MTPHPGHVLKWEIDLLPFWFAIVFLLLHRVCHFLEDRYHNTMPLDSGHVERLKITLTWTSSRATRRDYSHLWVSGSTWVWIANNTHVQDSGVLNCGTAAVNEGYFYIFSRCNIANVREGNQGHILFSAPSYGISHVSVEKHWSGYMLFTQDIDSGLLHSIILRSSPSIDYYRL